jgi:predicted ester cyclase
MVDASFIHRWFDEVWNGRSEAAIHEMFAEDGIAHGLADPDGNEIRGPEGFKKLQRAFLSAYPDMKIVVEDTVVEGDKIAARCRVTGSLQGEGIGVAPTSQPVEFTGMTIVRVQDGKIAEAWNEFNFMEMYRQVGALTLNLQ